MSYAGYNKVVNLTRIASLRFGVGFANFTPKLHSRNAGKLPRRYAVGIMKSLLFTLLIIHCGGCSTQSQTLPVYLGDMVLHIPIEEHKRLSSKKQIELADLRDLFAPYRESQAKTTKLEVVKETEEGSYRCLNIVDLDDKRLDMKVVKIYEDWVPIRGVKTKSMVFKVE